MIRRTHGYTNDPSTADWEGVARIRAEFPFNTEARTPRAAASLNLDEAAYFRRRFSQASPPFRSQLRRSHREALNAARMDRLNPYLNGWPVSKPWREIPR